VILTENTREVFEDDSLLRSGFERKLSLHVLPKVAKSTQIIRSVELVGVQCDVICHINEGGFGCIYKGVLKGRQVCVKAVRVSAAGAEEHLAGV
jgi:hypothetical protein